MTYSSVAQDRSLGEWLGAVAGIAAAAILIGIIVVVPTGPSADASGEEIKAALLAQGDAMLVGHYLEGLMLMLFLWFAASLHGVLRRAEEGNGTLAATMLG